MKNANPILKLMFFVSFSNAACIENLALLICQGILLIILYIFFADKRNYYRYVLWVLVVLLIVVTVFLSFMALYQGKQLPEKDIVRTLGFFIICFSSVIYFTIVSPIEIYNIALRLKLGRSLSIALYTAIRLLPMVAEEVRMIIFSMNSKGANYMHGIKILSKGSKKLQIIIPTLINTTTSWLEQLNVIFYLRDTQALSLSSKFKQQNILLDFSLLAFTILQFTICLLL